MTDWAKMLESAYSPITNTDTLLAALQKLQVLVDNGDAYLFRCYGTNSTMSGVAFGSPDGLRGLRAICYNSWVNKILVCAGEITLPAFIRMSETEQAAWLGEHTEHSMSVADLQVTAPVTIPDFKNLPSVVTSAADGVIIPIIAPVSASNGPAGLSSAGPAYGHVQVAKTGSTKAYNFFVQMDGSGAAKVYSGFLHSTAQTVSWTELGGGTGDDIIVIPEGTPVNDMDYYPIPRDQGTIIPIVIKAGAESAPPGGYEYVGTVQYIYGGTQPEMMINVCAAESDMIARNEWYQAHIDTEGISDWVKMGGSSGSSLPFDGPIPGYELVYSDTGAVLQLASGTEVTINFDKAIPAAQMFTSKARFMIEADIVSVSGNTLSNVARVPIAIFKPTAAGQPVFEYMIQSIATGTNIGRVRLIITSWIREAGSTGDITGCNLMAQVNNLNPSMNYALTFPGMYVKSSGGGQ